MLVSDNGTSAEGGRIGSFNEHRFTQMLPEDIDDNLAHLDEFGGFRSYNHYAWGWAWAGNTPLQLWKRFTWLGGTRTPLIVHWPNGMRARGEVREQLVHAIDVLPTVFGACGVEVPATVDGVTQLPIDGADFHATFDDPDAPNPREVQYFELHGLAVDHRRRLEGDDRPRAGRRGRRGGVRSWAAATSPTTTGRCSTWPRTSPRRATSRPSIPRWSRGSASAGWSRPGATRCCR